MSGSTRVEEPLPSLRQISVCLLAASSLSLADDDHSRRRNEPGAATTMHAPRRERATADSVPRPELTELTSDPCLKAEKKYRDLLELKKKEKPELTADDEKKKVELTTAIDLLFLDKQLHRLTKEIANLETAPATQGQPWQKQADLSLLKIKKASYAKLAKARERLLRNPGEVPLFRSTFEAHGYADRVGDKEPTEAERSKLAAESRQGGGGSYSKSKASGTYSKSKGLSDGGSGIEFGFSFGEPGELPIIRHQRIDFSALSLDFGLPWCRSDEDAKKAWAELLSNQVKENDNPELETFMRDIGVDPKAALLPKPSVDLSSKFHAPRSQGDTKACAAFAITSDLETFEGVPPLSAGLAYAFMVGDYFDARPQVTDDLLGNYAKIGQVKLAEVAPGLDQGAAVNEALKRVQRNPLAPEKAFPFSPTDYVPASVNAIPDRRYAVAKSVSAPVAPTAHSLARMLQAGKPPIVVLKTDSRDIVENWIRLKPGSMGHVFNVVGYGTEADPFDGRTKPYFIVRDSLTGNDGIHYRVDAAQLLDQALEVHKVTAAKILAPSEIPRYPKSR